MVGRARELDVLRGTWERATGESVPHLVTVSAPPGSARRVSHRSSRWPWRRRAAAPSRDARSRTARAARTSRSRRRSSSSAGSSRATRRRSGVRSSASGSTPSYPSAWTPRRSPGTWRS
jgi:hypothetical protein